MKCLMSLNQRECILAEYNKLVDIMDTKPRMFEYGSGGTTLWLLNHDVDLTSVEHNPKWHDELQRSDKRLDFSKQKLIAINPTHEENPLGLNRYITVCHPKDYEIILIDGVARGACLARLLFLCETSQYSPTIFIHDTHRDWYDWIFGECNIQRIKPTLGDYPAELGRIL